MVINLSLTHYFGFEKLNSTLLSFLVSTYFILLGRMLCFSAMLRADYYFQSSFGRDPVDLLNMRLYALQLRALVSSSSKSEAKFGCFKFLWTQFFLCGSILKPTFQLSDSNSLLVFCFLADFIPQDIQDFMLLGELATSPTNQI